MASDRMKRSKAQEKRFADKRGAKLHAGSGSGWSSRNDSHNEGELIENKRTDNTAFLRVDLKELLALCARADRQGRLPVLSIEIAGHDFVVLRDCDYQEIMG